MMVERLRVTEEEERVSTFNMRQVNSVEWNIKLYLLVHYFTLLTLFTHSEHIGRRVYDDEIRFETCNKIWQDREKQLTLVGLTPIPILLTRSLLS